MILTILKANGLRMTQMCLLSQLKGEYRFILKLVNVAYINASYYTIDAPRYLYFADEPLNTYMRFLTPYDFEIRIE